jgi:hypothetical protein
VLRRPLHPSSAALPLVVLTLALGGLALATGACDPVSDFGTGEGEAYCGAITLENTYRAGLSPRVQLRLRLDADKIEGGSSPGTISSYDAGLDEADRRLLDRAALRPIPPLDHDPLSQLEFGDGRERNLIYAVSPSNPAAESLLAIVSLRNDEAVEVRLLRAGSDAAADDPARRPLFGLFVLNRRSNDCGF